MNNKLKIKDFILIALLTAVYFIFYLVSMLPITLIGAFGHAISPGIAAILTGSVVYFMSRKVGKMWQFTIMTAIVMAAFALMGGGYLPWVLSSMVTAVIADLISSRGNDTPVFILALSFGLMQMGQAFGSIIPSWFFLDKYRADWIARGQTAEYMDNMIQYTAGIMGILASIVTFVLGFIGIYIGYFILRKQRKEK